MASYIAFAILITGSGSYVSAQPGAQLLHKHLPPQVSAGRAALVGTLPADEQLNLTIVLPLRNKEELTNLLARLYDPSDAQYRHFLSVAQFTERFGPSVEDYHSVVTFARAHGLVVTGAPANRMVVPVRGSVDQIGKAFHLTMNLYRHPSEDRTFFSPDREPSLDLATPVAHISGLNNFSIPQPMVRRSQQGVLSAAVTGSGPSGSYLGSDMRAAYYGGTTLDGNGQTIGILEFGGYDLADVDQSFSDAGQSYSVPIQNVLLDGASGLTEYNDAEQVLDIVQAIAMAPGLSQVRVYIGKGLDDANLLNSMASENLAKQLSCSWSWRPDDPDVDDPFFLEFAAQGQSFFVASGDSGAFNYSISPFFYPQEDGNVTAVGGTHLTTNSPGGAWASESVWNSNYFGSGGGFSPDGIALPAWQTGVVTATNGASSTLRNVPDVAMEGDFDNFSCALGVCFNDFAGTSFAAPRWAGFMALVNQQAVEAGKAPQGGIGFLNPSIYAIGKGKRYGSDFHDITVGNNRTSNQPVWFSAGTGYDLTTGLGSATGQALIDDLAGKQVPGFWLGASVRKVQLAMGGSATTTIAVTDAGGFTGNVTLALTSALPAGVTASWGTNPTSGSSILTLTATAAAPSSTTTLVITGTSGKLTATTKITVVIHTPIFDLSSSATHLQVLPNGSVTSTITVIPEFGFQGSVQLAVSGLPAGVTAVLSPNPATGASTLTLTANASVLGGPRTLTLKGTSGTLAVTKPLFLVVAAPTFTISAPQSLNVGQGASTGFYIAIYPEFGFTGNVSLTATGLPTGVTASFSPNPTDGTSQLTLTATAGAALGTSQVTIHGTSGKIQAAVIVPLGVFVPTFTVAGPKSEDMGQGTTINFPIQVNQKYGFAGNVQFSASGLPNGVSASFSPNPTTGFTTLSLTAAPSVALGTTTVTITGASGTLKASTTFPLSVHTPTFELAPPTTVSVGQGALSTNYVYVNAEYGFSGFVNLSLSGLPAGVTASFSPNPTNGTSLLTLTASSAAKLGSTTATMVGTYGNLKVTAPLTVSVLAQGFGLSIQPTVSIGKGTTTSLPVGIQPLNGFLGSVQLSVSGLPAGVTASFSPNPAATESILTLTASSAAVIGHQTVTVTGTSGSLTSTATFSLGTYAPAFTLSRDGSVEVGAGASATTYLNVYPLYGFTGSVTLHASGLPSGVTATFSPNPTNANSQMTVSASSAAAAGNSTFTVTGISGAQKQTTTLALSVKAPSFTLPATGYLDVGQGTTANYNLYINTSNGFTGNVHLAVSGLPDGVTATISPNPASAQTVVTVTASSAAALGTSKVTITGTSGALTSSTALSLSIHASTFTVPTPGATNLCQGVSLTNYYAIQPQYGFTGSAKLAFSGLPGGVVGSFSPNPTNGDTSYTLTASSAAVVGTKMVTITGTSGKLTASTTFPLTVCTPSFTLYDYSDVFLVPGNSATSYVSVNSDSGFTGSVQLSVAGLPSGVTASFSPNPTTGQSVLTLTASSSAALGTKTLTITGTAGKLTASTTVSLSVGKPSFSLSSNGDLSVSRGAHATTYVGISSAYGFTGNVQLSATGLPSGVTASFSPNPATGQSVMTLTAATTAALGASAVTVTGTSGTQTATTSFLLTVYPPSFTLESFGGVSVGVGNPGTAYIYVHSQTGFTGDIKLAVSGLPSGVTGAFSVNPTVNGDSNLTLTASGAASLGQYNITVTGTSLGQSSSTSFPITIQEPGFRFSNPYSVILGRGGSSTSYLYINPDPGFSGSVSLAVAGLPTGVTASFSVNPARQNTVLTLTASSTASVGQYTATLMGTSGTRTYSTSFSVGVYLPSFTLYSTGISDFGPGSSNTSYIGINSNYGFASSVKLAASGLPSGVTASFSNNPITNGSGVLTLQAGGSAIPGRYNLTVTGTAGGVSASTTIPFNIQAPTFTVNGLYQVVLGRGSQATFYPSITPLYGFTGNVSLGLIGLPAGVTGTFSPNPTNGQTVLTLTASNAASLGQYTVTMTGTSGALTLSTTFSVAVYAPAFTLGGPYGFDLGQGTSVTQYAQVNPEFGFHGSVTLAALNLPTGVTASFSPNPTTTSSELTLTATAAAPIGQSYVTIKGVSGQQTASVSFPVSIYVPTFTLDTYGSSISMKQGASYSSYLSVTPLYGFTGAVNLSVAGLPSGVTASFAPASVTNGYSVLTLKASSTASIGQYNLTLTGKSGAKTVTTPITLAVQQGP